MTESRQPVVCVLVAALFAVGACGYRPPRVASDAAVDAPRADSNLPDRGVDSRRDNGRDVTVTDFGPFHDFGPRVDAHVPPSLWAVSFGGLEQDGVGGLALDAQGNVIVAGSFSGSVRFGGRTHTASQHADPFVLKLDRATGKLLWIVTHKTAHSDGAGAPLVTPNGEILVGGRYDGAATVMRLSSSGKVLSMHRAALQQGTAHSGTGSLALDASGAVYLAGEFLGPAQFGATQLQSRGSHDAFIAKLGPSGFEWAVRFGGDGSERAGSLVSTKSGELTLVGSFDKTLDSNAAKLTCSGKRDAFIARFSPAGALLWARRYGGSGFDYAGGAAMDANGGMRVVGQYEGAVDFGKLRLDTGPGGHGLFVMRLDAKGEPVWVTSGGPGYSYAAGVALDRVGNLYVAGTLVGHGVFGQTALSGQGLDAMLFVVSPSGKIGWALAAGGAWQDSAYPVALGAGGELVLGGTFHQTVDFGGHLLTSEGVRDGFVWRLR